MEKNKRHKLIREIIRDEDVRSQQDLVDSLARSGQVVTQATVSRDIKELALVKLKNLSGSLVYVYQRNSNLDPSERLDRTLGEFGRSVDRSDNLVVVKTTPGAAQTVAKCIDEVDPIEIIGTVAGDDTILIIARDERRAMFIKDLFTEKIDLF